MNFLEFLTASGLIISMLTGWFIIVRYAFEVNLFLGITSVFVFLFWCWLIKWNIFTIKD